VHVRDVRAGRNLHLDLCPGVYFIHLRAQEHATCLVVLVLVRMIRRNGALALPAACNVTLCSLHNFVFLCPLDVQRDPLSFILALIAHLGESADPALLANRHLKSHVAFMVLQGGLATLLRHCLRQSARRLEWFPAGPLIVLLN